MIYLVHTLKQLGERTMNTDFVIEANEEIDIKLLMNKSKIIVLGLITVPGRPKSGRFFAKLENNEKSFTCCIAADTIEHACERCIVMELPIIDIKDNSGQTTEQAAQQLITKHKALYEEEKQKEKEKRAEEIRRTNTTIDSEKQKKITEIINQTVNEINTINKEAQNNAESIGELHQLNEYKELLTKMKMGSNIEKSTQILERVFEIMEKIELTKINQMKTSEEQITEESIISNVDIISELEKLKRAKQTNLVGMKKNTSDIYYTLFGIIGLYQKFIAKDIINEISKIKKVFSGIIFYSNFSLLTISLTLGIYTTTLFHNNISINKQCFYGMIILGISGIIFAIVSTIKEKSLIIIIFGVILAIVSIISIYRGILINLALF